MQYCAQPSCSALVSKGKCATHARQADQGTRGTAQQRGYDSIWAKYSQQFRKEHPFCGERADGSRDAIHSRCVQQGLDTPCECVDHTVPPPSRDHRLFMDPTNHMSACLACNTWKANTLDKRTSLHG